MEAVFHFAANKPSSCGIEAKIPWRILALDGLVSRLSVSDHLVCIRMQP